MDFDFDKNVIRVPLVYTFLIENVNNLFIQNI